MPLRLIIFALIAISFISSCDNPTSSDDLPNKPSVIFKSINDSSITLVWEEDTDPKVVFDFYLSSDAGKTFQKIESDFDNTEIELSLSPLETYFYYVVAKESSDEVESDTSKILFPILKSDLVGTWKYTQVNFIEETIIQSAHTDSIVYTLTFDEEFLHWSLYEESYENSILESERSFIGVYESSISYSDSQSYFYVNTNSEDNITLRLHSTMNGYSTPDGFMGVESIISDTKMEWSYDSIIIHNLFIPNPSSDNSVLFPFERVE